jgi:hypothetical protein
MDAEVVRRKGQVKGVRASGWSHVRRQEQATALFRANGGYNFQRRPFYGLHPEDGDNVAETPQHLTTSRPSFEELP